MKNKLKSIYDKKELCCVFYNEYDTEIFLIGWIVNFDTEYFIMECINSKGYNNGFVCRLIDSIIKIETKSKYLQSVEKLFYSNKQSRANLFKQTDNCLKSFLTHATEYERICFIELCESDNLDAVGYINHHNDEEVVIVNIDECGESDGEECLEFERISAVTLGNEEIIRLEKLHIINK